MAQYTSPFITLAITFFMGFVWGECRAIAGPVCFPVAYQDEKPDEKAKESIPNGNFESWTDKGPVSWIGARPAGSELRKEEERPYEGKMAAVIDATQDSIESSSFSNLMQAIPADAYRGKKVRLRAAIKTARLENNCRVQMWLRVDLKKENQAANGMALVGAFDNMDGRPIRNKDWAYVDIVLPVAENADQLALGLFIIGKGQAWIDDMTLEVVDANTPVTSRSPPQATATYQPPPKVVEAIKAADEAPRQPFFNHWLWLAIVAIALFSVGMAGPLPRDKKTIDANAPKITQTIWTTFAIRFSTVYWFLYFFQGITAEFSREPLGLVARMSMLFNSALTSYTNWLAKSLPGIQGELVPPNGSGDTTFNYVQILGLFLLSLAVGVLWTAVDRRATDNSSIRDVLRSWLRYALAFAMIGYGLAKFGFEGTQFGSLSSYQLEKTWGDSSPMNVLWAFMATSQAYTMFAGFGEIVAGLLIVWRRTTLLGAIVTFGVMTNVLMLNMCYDVPVKLYSSHLVLAAFLVLMPELQRLCNVFLLNRPAATVCLDGIWQARWAWWTRIVLKCAVVFFLVLLPVGMRIASLPAQWERFSESTKEAEASEYRVKNRGFRWVNEVPYNR